MKGDKLKWTVYLFCDSEREVIKFVPSEFDLVEFQLANHLLF